MLFLWAIPVAAAMWLVAVSLGFLAPPHATTLIRLRGGKLETRKGKMRALARDQVAEILQEAQVQNGFIAVFGGERVTFSRQIPDTIHQRLRNVILNQRA